jgi:hypothetical protein
LSKIEAHLLQMQFANSASGRAGAVAAPRWDAAGQAGAKPDKEAKNV